MLLSLAIHQSVKNLVLMEKLEALLVVSVYHSPALLDEPEIVLENVK